MYRSDRAYHGDESGTDGEGDDETGDGARPDLNPHSLEQSPDSELIPLIFALLGIVDSAGRVDKRRALDSRGRRDGSGRESASSHELFDKGKEDGDDDGCFDGLA